MYKKEVMIVIAPRQKYAPDIDALSNTLGLVDQPIKRISWNEMESGEKKEELEIDQKFGLTARVFGKYLEKSNIANGSGITTSALSYVTFDCPQDSINTYTWPCRNGYQLINSSQLCDTIPQCDDESDEDSFCRIQDSPFLKSVLWIVIGLSLSTLLFHVFVNRTTVSAKIREFSFLEGDDKMIDKASGSNVLLEPLNSKIFSTIMSDCKNIRTRRELHGEQVRMPFCVLEPTISLYRSYHEEHNDHKHAKLNTILETMRHIGLSPEFRDSVDILVDSILKLEQSQLHGADNGAEMCLKKTQKVRYHACDFFIATVERHGGFGKLKRKGIIKFESCHGIETAHDLYAHLSIALLIIMAIKNVVLYYADIYFDLTIGMSMDYLKRSFITSFDKWESIQNLNLSTLRIYYPLLSIISMIPIQIHCLYNIKKSNFDGAIFKQPFLYLATSLFPIPFLSLELCRAFVRQIKLEKKMKLFLSHYDFENTTNADYIRLNTSIEHGLAYIKEIKTILMQCHLLQVLLETLPQSVVIVALAIIDYQSPLQQLKTIFVDNIAKSTGVYGGLLCSFILLVNAIKFSMLPISYLSRKQYPMSLGILGSLIQFLAISIMMVAKILLGSLVVSKQPYMYPVILLLEGIVISIFCLLTKTKWDFLNLILPSILSVTLFTTGDEKPQISYLRHYKGNINVVVLHYLVLFLVYVPFYFLNMSNSTFHDEGTLVNLGFGFYCLSIIPYLALLLVYSKIGDRWNKNKTRVDTTDIIELTVTSDNSVERN